MLKTFFFLFFFFIASSLYAIEGSDFNKNIVLIPVGQHCLKDIELSENTIVKGEHKFLSVIKLSPGAKKALFYAMDNSNIEISNLTLINETGDELPLIHMEGRKKQIENITIKNCILKVPNAETDVVVFKKYISNIRIEDNTIIAKRNPMIRRDYTQVSCIRLQGVDSHSDNNSYIFIKNNLLKYGNCGFRISGIGTPPNPLWFDGNIIQGQVGCGGFFYHGSRQKITNNYFSDIIAVKMKNSDGGVVWLDAVKSGTILFSGNTIEMNHGNGIFIEELKDSIISNNQIINNKERFNDDYRINLNGKYFLSKGGNGILVTGGIVGLQIINNQIRNNQNNGILLNTYLGVHKKYSIPLLSVNRNVISGNKKYGINVEGKVRDVYISDNVFISEKEKYYSIDKSLLSVPDTNVVISNNVKLKTTKKMHMFNNRK